MATMLNGAAVMDAALLLVAGNETCPQPQTSEHLAAVEIMRLKNIIILQNKVDLIKEDAALAQHEQIKKFVAGTVAQDVSCIRPEARQRMNFFRPRLSQYQRCSSTMLTLSVSILFVTFLFREEILCQSQD